MAQNKETLRQRRKGRIRKKMSGTAEKPRLSVYRSNRHMVLQAIDDVAGHTIVSVHTVEKDLKAKFKNNNITTAGEAAAVMAQRAKSKGINSMVFDRNGFAYHGRVRKIAESLRENGIRI